MLDIGALRPPTRGELKVILFCAALLFFALGTLAIVLGIRAPAEKARLAHEAIFYGCWSYFFGLVFLLCLWLYCRFTRDD